MGCLNTDLNKLGSKEVYSRVYDYFKSNFPTQEKTISKQSDSLDVDKYSEGSKKDLKIEMMTQDFIGNLFITISNAQKEPDFSIENLDNYIGKALKYQKFNILSDISREEKRIEKLKSDPKYTWERNPFGVEPKATVRLEHNPDYGRCPSIRKAINKVISKLKDGTNSKEYLIGKYLLKYEFTPKEIASKLNLKLSWTYEIISGIKEKLKKVLREDVYENNISRERIWVTI